MRRVNMHDAKSQLSKLVEAVESGSETEVVIARNGKPVARLLPLAPAASERIGGARSVTGNLLDDITLEKFNEGDEDIERLFYGSSL